MRFGLGRLYHWLRLGLGGLLMLLVRLYQLVISPLLPPACRFTPTCSSYALEALRLYGPWRGTWRAGRRLGRCHPFPAGGYDPVPHPPSPSEEQP